ncbi:chromosome segregation SMC family protein [Spirochaeta cellobiosiphila]|uniref:chromosome segregation SMC family protein n=1 Tax=Spirochaeta cellobiosiphila TaxID=504483 RepID=UPI0004160BA5|nr:AAA family ATPase [Spirochaeta cellobiosiphila]
MFLKHVELFGFKSFADRTKIDFADGISALLGPNGCGKSNVVDSIKWVLGEQSYKTLRASKMEDVIFNGTQDRKALNIAEVTLTISNDEGILDLDMPEVAIKRRLYRSGESEYFINNTPVKLKELRELFFDTGVGKSAYSIMEQGKIDQILSNKPEERRYIFEEAAGITKYKIKGSEAERKLQRTNDNIKQVESIISEVKRSHDNLKIQSDKTIEYRKAKDNIFYLELDIQLLRLQKFLEEKNSKELQLEKISKLRTDLKDKIMKLSENLQSNQGLVSKLENDLIQSQKELYGIDLEKNNIEAQKKYLQEEQTDLLRRLRQQDLKIQEYNDKYLEINNEITAKNEQEKSYKARIDEIQKNILSYQESINQSLQSIELNKNKINDGEKSIVKFEDDLVENENRLRTITDNIVAKLEDELNQSGYTRDLKQNKQEDVIKSIQSLRLKLKSSIEKFWDQVRFNNISNQNVEEFVGTLREQINLFDQIYDSFNAYIAIEPSLIDDFLSPESIFHRKKDLDNLIFQIKDTINQLRTNNKSLAEQNVILSERILKNRSTLEELKVNQAKIITQSNSLKEIRVNLERDSEETLEALNESKKIKGTEQTKYESINNKIEELNKKQQKAYEDEKKLKDLLLTLEKKISQQNSELEGREKELNDCNIELAKNQSKYDQISMSLTQNATEIRNLNDNFRERYSRDLDDFTSRLINEIKDMPNQLKERLANEKNHLKSLGQVNLMAPEEFIEVKERYDFLNSQINDLINAQEDLKRITSEIHKESTQMFLRTYKEIKKNFHHMFRQLFGGGRGELKLTDEDNPLESGIEMYCQPPGKKLESIDLLSGGERSLTAVGLLFATYLVKPSPFCILDEIDAALDESNVGRFVNMLMEFGQTSQFIVITHNKKTVAGAKTLLGVTMEESGVSKTIAIRIEGAEVS